MDPRLLPFSGRVAHVGLRGLIEAEHFTKGEPARIAAPLVDLDRHPGGPRDRQLLLGDAFLVIDRRDGMAFGRTGKDGYCGWVPEAALGADHPVTHRVAAPATHLYPEPRVQAREISGLSFGAQLQVTGTSGAFAETSVGFVPAAHLRALSDPFRDPVGVAELFIGTPYLWGGNSRSGIDCSGLVQAALLSCGIDCPGDSDLQAALGRPLSPDAPLQRGDLLFWKGHVAFAESDRTILHASGHHMAVVREDLSEAVDRIEAQGHGRPAVRRMR
ncbi:MAG: NlpC/P60 family protein [Gemmobacter sp.]